MTTGQKRTYTKYDFNKVELCEGLNANKLKELGFTNYNPEAWYFCSTISQDEKHPSFHETFNIRISNHFKDLESEILDEAFCQPCLPYVEYYLHERPLEKCTPYICKGIKKCDEYIEFLIQNNVIRFKE